MEEEKIKERKLSRRLSQAMSRGELVKRTGGLSVLTATIFLAGEMAGAGLLKLPKALVGTGKYILYEKLKDLAILYLFYDFITYYFHCTRCYNTGWAGVAILVLFTIVSCYCGTRLGICANILAERYDEFRHEIRDPYPAMGFKAYGQPGRLVLLF